MSLLRNFVPVELTIDAGQLNLISIRIVDNCQPNFEFRTVRIMAQNLLGNYEESSVGRSSTSELLSELYLDIESFRVSAKRPERTLFGADWHISCNGRAFNRKTTGSSEAPRLPHIINSHNNLVAHCFLGG